MKTLRRTHLGLPMATLIAALGFSAGCTRKSEPPQTNVAVTAANPPASKSERKKEVWTCPMHHQIHKDHPGTCPICGMTLVKVAAGDEEASATNASKPALSTTPEGHASFKLNAIRQQMIGVKTGLVEKKPLFKSIEAAGRVAFDPELYTAQNEYLEALRQEERVRESPIGEVKHSAGRMVESAKLRLKVLGLSDKQIASITASGASGSNLLVPKPGENLWVYAEVFEMDLPAVRAGMEASISGGALEGRSIIGKVVSVDRVINPATRTAKVRISVPNGKALLRPESYVDVSIRSPMGEQTTVPFDAVLDTGKEAWVFVVKGQGEFEPRSITMKFRADDEVAVESGVSAGEKIVTSANFLIDSESRLQGARMAQEAPAAGGEGAKKKATSCPKGQHWDVPMAMCMPD